MVGQVLPYSNTVISTLLHQGGVRVLLVSCWVISRQGSQEANYSQLLKHEGLWNSKQDQALSAFPLTHYSIYSCLCLEYHHEIRTRGRGLQVEWTLSVLICMNICPISHWGDQNQVSRIVASLASRVLFIRRKNRTCLQMPPVTSLSQTDTSYIQPHWLSDHTRC